MNRDFALLIGINEYPSAELAGCIPDVKRGCDNLPAPGLIKAGIGLNWDCLDACTDDRAHAEGMRNRLARLVAGAAPGDRLLFWYSGHGAQIPTRDGLGEVDGMFETLCPYDFDFDDPDTWLTDVDFAEIFGGLADGVSCTIVLDSCFSGGMPESVRALGQTERARAWPRLDRVDFLVRRRAAGVRGITIRQVGDQIIRKAAIVSACLEHETATDAIINGYPNGALTYYFWEAILEDFSRSLRAQVDVALQKLRKAGYSQTPVVTGPDALLDAPFLTRL